MTEASEGVLDVVAADVASIKQDVDQILPSLVDALKRNRYFDEMEKQLRRAERVAEAWREWPLVVGIHDVILAMRTDGDSNPAYAEQLADVLFRAAGVEEFGFVGDVVDPMTVEISNHRGEGERYVVTECQRPGLRIGHSPIRKAIVSVERQGGQA